ncbi:DUF6343 family protein [Streptacidiphilus carbonis]|jgi:hypothetical protein|uniref:DUF6343 family protein n=1 Tax=Streptacidiphilus carbonis TaxID=105422 RepID=UPI000ABAA369|nr:hypothetical protein [Streptacidiphilus carbonis]
MRHIGGHFAHGTHLTRGEMRRFANDGSEPVTARSDLPARRLLAQAFGALFLAGTVFFCLLAAGARPGSSPGRLFFTVYAVICAFFVLVAVVDLAVVRRRAEEQRRWGR